MSSIGATIATSGWLMRAAHLQSIDTHLAYNVLKVDVSSGGGGRDLTSSTDGRSEEERHVCFGVMMMLMMLFVICQSEGYAAQTSIGDGSNDLSDPGHLGARPSAYFWANRASQFRSYRWILHYALPCYNIEREKRPC